MHYFPSWDSYHTHLKKIKNGNEEPYKTSSEDSILKNPREYFLEFDTPKASKTNRPMAGSLGLVGGGVDGDFPTTIWLINIANWKPWPIDDKHEFI